MGHGSTGQILTTFPRPCSLTWAAQICVSKITGTVPSGNIGLTESNIGLTKEKYFLTPLPSSQHLSYVTLDTA